MKIFKRILRIEAIGTLIRKYHAKGPATKHRKGETLGQKSSNSGIPSERKRTIRAKIGIRTKKKKYGKVMSNRTKLKIKRAMSKRPEE